MTIQLNQASELLMSIALFVASLVMIRYTRHRIKELPQEDKRMGRPLYAYAVGTFAMGTASLANYLSAVYPIGQIIFVYTMLALLAPCIISIAALVVLGRGHFVVPVVLSVVLIGTAILVPYVRHPSQLLIVAGIISAILYLPAFALFGYILYRARRATSFGLFYLVAFYPLYPITLIALPPFPVDLLSLVVGLRLFGPAITAAAFQIRDIGISIELAGYGMAYALIAFWFSYTMISVVSNPVMLVSLTAITIGATIGFGTGSYTYARWKKSRLAATFALFLSFTFATWAFILFALQGIGLATAVYYTYAYIYLTFVALVCFNLAVFLALEWRSLILLPVLIVLPLMIYLATLYPVEPRSSPLFYPVIAVTGVITALVPVVLYLYLGLRMRRVMAPNVSRPFLLAVGILEVALGMAVGPALTGLSPMDVANPVSGFLILAGFLSWWLGVTGKLEGFTKWWYGRSRPRAPATTSAPVDKVPPTGGA
jgi:hypothetical protein